MEVKGNCLDSGVIAIRLDKVFQIEKYSQKMSVGEEPRLRMFFECCETPFVFPFDSVKMRDEMYKLVTDYMKK